MISSKTITALEFDKVLLQVAKYAESEGGKNKIYGIKPLTDCSEVKVLLDETQECDILLYRHALSPELYFESLADILDKAAVNSTLSMGEILKVGRALKVARNLADMIIPLGEPDIILLKDYARELFTDKFLEEDIAKSIINESEMSDSASATLKDIRRAILKCNDSIRSALNYYITAPAYAKYLQDNIVTIRNNRYVIPVRSEHKSHVQGLVHDQSASGATVFIEPFNVVQLNNELATLKINEQHEIERILKAFSVRIAGEKDEIAKTYSLLTYFDSIFAKAKYARHNKGTRPLINGEGIIDIKGGRHPLIDKSKVVPVNLSIEKGEKILLITGPNTGGKTVSLKLVGLCSLMTMSGIYPPVDEDSEIAVFSSIFCDIGDMQSIEHSLSTFSSHIVNIISITDMLEENSLVLLDELGGGTDPEEGAALAIAVTDYLIKNNATAIITTHYQELKNKAALGKNIKCASMDFNPLTFAPTYRLLMNSAGGSKALQIAGNLGLNKEILNDARANLTKEKLTLDSVLEEAEKARSEAERDREIIYKSKQEILAELREVKREREALQKERIRLDGMMKKELKNMLRDYTEEADETIEEMKKLLKDVSEENLFAARKLKSRLSDILDYEETASNKDSVKIIDGKINVGDSVYVKSLDNKGIVLSIDERKKEYTVKAGVMTTKVKFDTVKKIAEPKENTVQSSVALRNGGDKPKAAVPLEINLIGQTVDEAVYNVDTYINNAVMAGYAEVRIVHGKGSGALRKGLQNHFKSHPNIEEYRTGKYGEGEDGVTIVKLK